MQVCLHASNNESFISSSIKSVLELAANVTFWLETSVHKRQQQYDKVYKYLRYVWNSKTTGIRLLAAREAANSIAQS
eukprot:7681-Heterococcus_DN1.PRE.4